MKLTDTARTAPLRFVVAGPIVPWQRTRGSGSNRYTDPDYKAYAEAIGWAAKQVSARRGRVPFGEAAVAISIGALLSPPFRCDADNVAKAVCDAIQGIVIKDDRQVVRLLVAKLPAVSSRDEALQVEVRRYDPERPWP